MSRRQLLETGLRLGLASPVITSLIDAASGPAAATPDYPRFRAQPGGCGASRVQPHLRDLVDRGHRGHRPALLVRLAYLDHRAAVYEMLLVLKGGSTDEFEPMLAESWEATDDQSTYTFKLYPDVTFQVGTPANAQAVKRGTTES